MRYQVGVVELGVEVRHQVGVELWYQQVGVELGVEVRHRFGVGIPDDMPQVLVEQSPVARANLHHMSMVDAVHHVQFATPARGLHGVS